MKTILALSATVALAGTSFAQTQLPLSADQTYVPGLTPNNVTVPFGARATTACDDFNRAALGADWIPAGGSPGIFSNAFGSASGNSMAEHANASLSYDSAVISIDLPDNPTALTYGAAVHGLGGSDNLFTKVQSQGGTGQYNYIGFYHGFNGGGTGGYGGFQAMAQPVNGGIVTFYVSGAGDIMNIDIDENRDGVVDQNIQASGINAAIFGMGNAVGIGAYGSSFASADDFELNGGCGPVGPTLSTSGSCPGVIGVSVTGMTANGNFAVVAGTAGSLVIPGSFPCAGTLLGVDPNGFGVPPIYFGPLAADGAGNATIAALGVAPSAACGLAQLVALDLTTCGQSNVVSL